MEKVIGLGKTGCGIAQELTAYPEYRIYKVGPDDPGRGDLVVLPCSNIQEYEEQVDEVEIAGYFRSIQEGDDVLLIMGGGEAITGMALMILQELKRAHVTLLYVCPDKGVSTQVQKRDHKIVGSVLQEYARSGMFDRIFLVDRAAVEDLVGDVAIRDYEKSINYFIAYVVAMVNYYDHTDAVMSNRTSVPTISRIGTFGIGSLEEHSDIKYLFELGSCQDTHHYYGIPSPELEENNQLLRKIKDQTKRATQEGVDTSFSVYSTTFDDLMVLCIAYTKDVQALSADVGTPSS